MVWIKVEWILLHASNLMWMPMYISMFEQQINLQNFTLVVWDNKITCKLWFLWPMTHLCDVHVHSRYTELQASSHEAARTEQYKHAFIYLNCVTFVQSQKMRGKNLQLPYFSHNVYSIWTILYPGTFKCHVNCLSNPDF